MANTRADKDARSFWQPRIKDVEEWMELLHRTVADPTEQNYSRLCALSERLQLVARQARSDWDLEPLSDFFLCTAARVEGDDSARTRGHHREYGRRAHIHAALLHFRLLRLWLANILPHELDVATEGESDRKEAAAEKKRVPVSDCRQNEVAEAYYRTKGKDGRIDDFLARGIVAWADQRGRQSWDVIMKDPDDHDYLTRLVVKRRSTKKPKSRSKKSGKVRKT